MNPHLKRKRLFIYLFIRIIVGFFLLRNKVIHIKTSSFIKNCCTLVSIKRKTISIKGKYLKEVLKGSTAFTFSDVEKCENMQS